MDDKKFFDLVRSSLFNGTMTQSQVDGLNRLLSTWEQFYAADPIEWLAYDLGTSFWETARTMQPITERGPIAYFSKYEPGTKLGKILGNTHTGDGYRYRGLGDVQNTGRANAAVATAKLNAAFGLNIDLVAHPEMRGDPIISAHSLFLGNKQGWWTGRKLGDYIAPPKVDFINARRVINGLDKAMAISAIAQHFLDALKLSTGA